MTLQSTPIGRHKCGDTFDLSGRAEIAQAGTALVDLTGWTGRSQLRDLMGNLVAELAFSWINAATRDFRVYALDTSAWQPGPVEMDVQFTSPGGHVVSTSTARIDLIRDVTR